MSMQAAIIDQLSKIQDPCSIAAGVPIDIVSMGLIGRIEEAQGHVTISLVLTEPACWFSQSLSKMAEQAALKVEGVSTAKALLDDEVIWTPDRMKPQDRTRLGFSAGSHEMPAEDDNSACRRENMHQTHETPRQ